MKYKLIFLSVLILCGCQSINVFNFEKSLKKTETIENVFYENFSAKGIVKFYAKNKKISSRSVFFFALKYIKKHHHYVNTVYANMSTERHQTSIL